MARAFLGHLARARGDLAEATALYTAARTTHERLGNTRGTASAGHDLALLALDEDRTDEAEQLLTEALELFDSIDYDWAVAVCACLLAKAVVRRGGTADVDRAAALLARALRLHDEVGERRGIAQSLEGMAEVAAARGAPATAARLVGAAAARRERASALATEAEVRQLAELDRRLDLMLGRSAAQRERHAGRTMSPAAAVALALELAASGPDDAEGDVVVLTPRQREVAIHVAAGRTNRQIGTALGISEKTTEVHVHNIMERLDVPSRAGVAAWAAARGLTQPPAP